MAAIVGIDAKIEVSDDDSIWTEVTERNEFSISINVDVAEHKPFVTSLSAAWVSKARTWMSWSGSMNGYYDDASDTVFDTVVAGAVKYMRFTNSRNNDTKRWKGQAIWTSIEVSNTTDDFATLSVDFEGSGALTRETIT